MAGTLACGLPACDSWSRPAKCIIMPVLLVGGPWPTGIVRVGGKDWGSVVLFGKMKILEIQRQLILLLERGLGDWFQVTSETTQIWSWERPTTGLEEPKPASSGASLGQTRVRLSDDQDGHWRAGGWVGARTEPSLSESLDTKDLK